MTQEQKKFIERVGALAAADMQKSGVLASMTIAQAILESGWGKSGLTVKGNALFGIKAGTSWTGAVYSGKTQECYDGVTFTTVTGLFRAYGSWAESVADHSDLLSCKSKVRLDFVQVKIQATVSRTEDKPTAPPAQRLRISRNSP